MVLLLLASVSSIGATVIAQDLFLNLGGTSSPLGGSDAEITLTQETGTDSTVATLKILVPVPEDAYVYASTGEFSGRTRINFTSVVGLEPLDEQLVPARKPYVYDDPVFEMRMAKFEEPITWTQKFRITPEAATAGTKLAGKLRYQICTSGKNGTCTPFDVDFDLTIAELDVSGIDMSLVAEPVFEAEHIKMLKTSDGREVPGPSVWTARLTPEDSKPSGVVTVSVTARMDDGYHTFALDQNRKNLGLPTVLTITHLFGLDDDGSSFQPDTEVENHEVDSNGNTVVQRIHHGEVTWSRTFVVTDGATGYGAGLKVTNQVCDENKCIRGSFAAELGVVPPSSSVKAPVVYIPPETKPDVRDPFDDLIKLRGPDEGTSGSLAQFLLYAFIGGLILNVMPCVLPVIAIKLLSFVQQAGESRSRILALNLSYSLGLLVVFLTLATLAAFAGMAWGELFGHAVFIVGMCALVFAMALSLLGVFEIPIPGMVGSVGAQQREGLLGAFLTGIFATLLATPCSGPFLGVTLGWSLQQDPATIYLVWTMMALGMASPYLVFGLFPGAIKLLPKPGMWMVRFKEFSGFVLLATTVYLVSILGDRYVVPTLLMLLGMGLGLWMIGNLYNLSSTAATRWKVRFSALILTGVICGFGYKLYAGGEKLPWAEYSEESVAQALDEGRPVLIDFTADWCPNCKFVEQVSLNTYSTRLFVEEHNVLTLKADWTDRSEEIKATLAKVNSSSIPVTVIFSPTRPKEPIVLRDVYFQSTLLESLQAAVSEEAIESDAAPEAAAQTVMNEQTPKIR
jgi:cytochrome c biogenesis protein CcdA/thiol-disulfide isomerase/thioredoxin